MNVVKRTICLLVGLAMLVGTTCNPPPGPPSDPPPSDTSQDPNDPNNQENPPDDPGPEDPPVVAQVPYATQCAASGLACYDEFARVSIDLLSYRPTSRWPKINLTWRLATPLPGIPLARQVEACEQALKLWSDVSSLTFQQVATGGDVLIDLVGGTHGDDFPFDGPPSSSRSSNVLGHSFFPGSSRPGAVHIDATESWGLTPIGAGQLDLFTVILHETGHALGLEHDPTPGAVMYPGYQGPLTQLASSDIAAIRRLYGSQDQRVLPLPNAQRGNLPPPPNLGSPTEPDLDNDGIPDSLELLALGTSPTSADTDGDGVSDFDEIFIFGTSPTSPPPDQDSDGDGLSDAEEIALGLDPFDPDTDGEGVDDGEEVLFAGTDPLLVDTDGDGFTDAQDPFPTNPHFPKDCNFNGVFDHEDVLSGLSEDCDGDNQPDECEPDSDSDGVIDDCDVCPGHPDFDDLDSDGVPDGCDNCPWDFNPLQLDSDQDGLGDACDD